MRYLKTSLRALIVSSSLEHLARAAEVRIQRPRGSTLLRFRGNGMWASRRRPGRLRFRCEGGSVWITQGGDERDVVLRPGDAWTSNPTGKVVVQVLGETGACVSEVPVVRLY
jgi:hypothetical protein